MQLLPLPAFADNYVWTMTDAAGRGIVVDPGQAEPVLQAAAGGLQPTAILLTHHHPDHIGGTAALLQRWPDLPVFAPEDDRIDLPCRRVGDSDEVRVGEWRFQVLAVPGHTRSHVAFFGHGVLFCGDTLFSLGCGRLFEGTPAQMVASLDALAALPVGTRVCCGHEYTLSNAAFALAVEPGNAALRTRSEDAGRLRALGRPTLPSGLGDELAANPFLRIDQPAVIAALTAHLGHTPPDRVAAFAALRAWKDGFAA
jgi:hydroxyacylglutathione hydrolase